MQCDVEYGCRVTVFATASGAGSWPGTAARKAAEVVVGELAGAVAHIVELPARGVGADLLGRAGALLIDVAIDTVPRGYRIAARPGGQDASAAAARAVSELPGQGIGVSTFALGQPSLDEVFLALTGHSAQGTAAPGAVTEGTAG